MTADFSFLNLTMANRANGANQVNNNNQAQQNQKANNDKNNLQKTDIFTAEKNGMQGNKNEPKALAGGDSGFSGTNAFGDSGFGDTVSFTTKTQSTPDVGTPKATGAMKMGSGMSFANNDNQLKELAESLGVDVNEDAVKQKLSDMSPEQLVKLDGDMLDIAADMGLISMSEIEKKIEAKNGGETKKEDQEDPFKKMEMSGFGAGNEV